MFKPKVAIPLIAASKLIPDLRLGLKVGARMANSKMRRETMVKTNRIQDPLHPDDAIKLGTRSLSKG